jgi:hypothetical protein
MVTAVVTGFSIRRKARGSDVLYTVPLIDGDLTCHLLDEEERHAACSYFTDVADGDCCGDGLLHQTKGPRV